MSNKTDYVPRNDGKFLEWVKFLFACVQEHSAKWNINPIEYANILPLITAFEAAYNKAQAPNHGTADIQAKNDARDPLEEASRKFVQEFLANNHYVSNEERKIMAIPVYDNSNTPPPIPGDMPTGKVDFSQHRRHTLHVKAGSLTGKSKPPKVRGFEVWRKTGADPAAKFEYVGFSTRSTFVMDYPEELVGQTASYRVRWMNSRNQAGPWNEDDINAVIA